MTHRKSRNSNARRRAGERYRKGRSSRATAGKGTGGKGRKR